MDAQITFGPPIDALLERLYEQHVSQSDAMGAYFAARAAEGSLDWNRFDDRTNEFLRDKLVALERPKAEFCYHVSARSAPGGLSKPGLPSASRRSFWRQPCVTTAAGP